MRLFSKIMLSTISVLTIGLSVCGYFLISQSFNNSMESEIKKGTEEYSLLKYTLRSGLLNESRSQEISEGVLQKLAKQTVSLAPDGTSTAVYSADGKCMFSDFPEDIDLSGTDALNDGETGYIIKKIGNKSMLVISGLFEQNGTKINLYAAADVSEVIYQTEEQKRDFLTIYILLLLAGSMVAFLLSKLITEPVGRLTKVSRYIADGNFGERAKVKTNDEIGQLSGSFNRMADVVEEKISALELEAKKREEFIADFSHELKTPLTAIVGYADMLYSKEYDRESQKKASYYILNESLRLEALSKKLMELIVLDKQDFVLEQLNAADLLNDVCETMGPDMQRKSVLLNVEAESCVVRIECDLMKAMLMNLIDNAVKADARHILLSGKHTPDGYSVCVRDDGRGVPADELSRITEAFYMVDKSRARKQHGAGLGLAICSKIAVLHHTALQFSSEIGKGTEVRFSLPACEEDVYD